MTPEKAKQLLERVKEKCPLPWEIFTDETIAIEPQQVRNIRYQDDDFNGHLAYVMDYDGTVDIDPDAIELIAAAPVLAELVAGLRYEYAVQVKCDGAWVMEEDSYWGTYSVAAVRSCRTYEPSRIVRRLVGEPEVVE